MLQQTQVDTVIPYYYRFIERFSIPEDLAEAPEQSVLKEWEGLGYYSRARNLQRGVREVVEQYAGQLPEEKEQLLSIHGIGPYTAGALLSIAFNKPEPAIDGNVMRVMSRIFLIDADIAKAASKKIFEQVVSELIAETVPSAFNQALMDLGAMVCRPKKADCGICPVKSYCKAYEEGVTLEYPVKSRKAKAVNHSYAVLLLQDQSGSYLIQQRAETGLLANLWQFPMIEIASAQTERSLAREIKAKFGLNAEIQRQDFQYTHHFSHLIWNLSLYSGTYSGDLPENNRLLRVKPADFERYPFPVSHQKVISWLKKNRNEHIKKGEVGKVKDRGGDTMAKKMNAGTDAEQVKKQNAQSQNGQFSGEFGNETNAQEVRQQNKKSQQNKQ